MKKPLTCPFCQSKISQWRLKRQFNCHSCGGKLRSKNMLMAMVLVFGIMGVVATPASLMLFGATYLSLVVEGVVLIILMHVINIDIYGRLLDVNVVRRKR